VKFNELLNMQFEGKNSLLHLLAAELSLGNFENTRELMKILIRFGCSPSLRNEKNQTASDIVDSSSVTSEMKTNLRATLNWGENARETAIDTETKLSLFVAMKNLLISGNVDEFAKSFLGFRSSYDDTANECAELLELAIVKNLPEAVKLIVCNGVDLNFVPLTSMFGKEPAFVAASLGRTEILLMLVAGSDLQFHSQLTGKNLLHEILICKHVEVEKIEQMFALVISDPRCTIEIINGEDMNSKSPLYYACVRRFDSITLQLLERGAYIGSKSIVDVVEPGLVTEFLDQCLTRKENVEKDDKVLIDFQFLVPTTTQKVPKSEALKNIAENSKFNEVLKHPVLTTFLDLKWNAFKWLFAVKSILHFVFLALIVFTLYYFVEHHDEFDYETEVNFILCFRVTVVVMTIIEVYQIVTSFRTYFFKLGNWLDLMTVLPILFILISHFIEKQQKGDIQKVFVELRERLHITSAFLILFVSGQTLRIFGWSIYTTMLRKVSSSFFKLLLMYSFLFVTFALSFHILFKAEGTTFVNNDLVEYSKSISSNLEEFNDLDDVIGYKVRNATKLKSEVMDVLTNNLAALEFITVRNKTIHFKYDRKQYDYSVIGLLGNFWDSNDELDFSLKNVKDALAYDIVRSQVFKNIREFLKEVVQFQKLITEDMSQVENFIRDLEISSILSPLNLCTIELSDIQRFFESVETLSEVEDVDMNLMCEISKDSQQDFLKNVLKTDSYLKLFDLCNKSVENVDDLLRTVLPLELPESASFETFCGLNEASLDEVFKNLFDFDESKVQSIKNFCQTKDKTPSDALTSFFGTNKAEIENICTEKQIFANESWSNLQATLNLNASHRRELETLCNYNESFYHLAIDSVFSLKFSENSELKELCFMKAAVRKNAIEEGYVVVKMRSASLVQTRIMKLIKFFQKTILLE
jgi:hypothetical protein